jgi:hypothetical protein
MIYKHLAWKRKSFSFWNDPSNELQLIDLSLEYLKTRNGRLLLKDEGISYLNPAFDSSNGKLMLFFGYCDDKPKVGIRFGISYIFQCTSPLIKRGIGIELVTLELEF